MMTKNPDYTPSSDQIIEFEFYVRKQVEDSSDFISVQDEIKDGIQKFRIFLKQHIYSVVVVEIKRLKEEIGTNLVESLSLLLRGQLLSINSSIDDRHIYVTEIFKTNHQELIANTSFTYNKFCKRHKEVNNITKPPWQTHCPDVKPPLWRYNGYINPFLPNCLDLST